MESVEVVISNFCRYDNVVKIVEAFKNQSVPCIITICDCASDESQRVRDDLANNIFRFKNYGPFNRYIPSFSYSCVWTYFHDDDMLPGNKTIEHFLMAANEKSDGALFGQVGRNIIKRYNTIDVQRQKECIECSMLVRGYFVKTKFLPYVKLFKDHIPFPVREDDMLLSWAIKTYTDKKIYLTGDTGELNERMNIEELPDTNALSSDPNHISKREKFWNMAKSLSKQILSDGLRPVT